MVSKNSLIPSFEFKQILRQLHNHLYGGGPIKTESKLAHEVGKVVLCKIADELSSKNELHFFITAEEFSTPLGREQASARLLKIQEENNISNNNFELGSYWLAEIIWRLQKYSLTSNKSYVSPLADVYEIFNSGQFKGGRGQFFTPPVTINLAFQILNPTQSDIVIDPACGSGNFLLKVLGKFCDPNSISYINGKKERENYVINHVYGTDIEGSLVDLAIEQGRLLSEEIRGNIRVGDSLDLNSDYYQQLPIGKFTKLFTNPPFGSNIQITDKNILSSYDFGHHLDEGNPTNQLLNGQTPDILFLEMCIKLLANGGEAAIVLPRQILSGDERYSVNIRKWLFSHTTIIAVIDLPPETFQPYTGTITSLLVLRKGKTEENIRIFMAVCENVGHDRRGLPLYKINEEGEILTNGDGQKLLKDNTLHILNHWLMFKKTGLVDESNHLGFIVDYQTVISNPNYLLNAWAYNPNANTAYKKVMKLALDDQTVKVSPLRDVCKKIFIPHRHKRKYVEKSDTSIAFLSTSQIFHIHDINYKYQPRSIAEKYDLEVEEGWLLVTRSGSTGRVKYVNKEISNFAISDHCIRLVPNMDLIDPGYLYTFLSSEVGQLLIDKGRYASVIETLSHNRLGDIPIPIPDMKIQKRIGDLVRKSEELRFQANILRNDSLEKLDKIIFNL